MSCCTQKKYYSELCDKCKEELVQMQQIHGDFPYYPEYPNMEVPGMPSSKCECGSQIVNGPGHSHWCPKYEQRD